MTAVYEHVLTPAAEKFEEFHFANPGVYNTLVELAHKWRERHPGKKISIALLVEVARWEHMMLLTYDANSEFKISNSYRAFYARLMMHNHPEFDGLFNIKSSEADEWVRIRTAQL